MSFDDYNTGKESGSIGTINRCKPDYEAQAANIKKKLDITIDLESALFKFKQIVGGHSFSNISSFAEMLGGVVIKRDEFSRHYEELLSQIEKES